MSKRPLTDRDRAFRERLRQQADDKSARGSAGLLEIACTIERETEKAWLIHDGARQAWIPKSQAKLTDEPPELGVVTIELPEWLAKDKGLI